MSPGITAQIEEISPFEKQDFVISTHLQNKDD